MVKNTKGGKGSKGFARKLLNVPAKTSVRVPENPLEVFAIVTKFYGTMCDVTTVDGKTYKCIVRQKFRKRSKAFCIVAVGNIILVGFRDFEAPNFKTCDLLETYDPNDVRVLANMPSINIQPLIAIQNAGHSSSTSSSDLNFGFSNDADADFETASKPSSIAVAKACAEIENPTDACADDHDEEINPDDI